MDKGRLLNLVRRFKRIYEGNEPYMPGSSWALTGHQQDHERRVTRAQRLLSLEYIPRLTEAELRELFDATDALGFFRDKGKRDRVLDELLSGEGTERIRSALLSLFQMAEAELTPEAFLKAQQPPGVGPLLISELLSHRFPSRYYIYSSNVTLTALKILGEDVKATQPPGKKGDHFLYFAIRPLMDEICDALRKAGFTQVDYMLADMFIRWVYDIKPPPDDGPPSLEDGLIQYFISQGLHFTSSQLATFYTALKTKGFVILTGISGTGKTKLAQYFAELLGSKDQFHFAAVRPDWRDSKSLLGYYNPLSGQFESTGFLRFILKAHQDLATPYFILLDEMNLAKVEYYFADFLSVLESGRQPDGFTKEAIALHPFGNDIEDADGMPIPPHVKLPPNLCFVGTVNVDETTYMFSPKVLDRAFTLELGTVNLEDYPGEQGEPLSDAMLEQLRTQLLPDFTRQGQFAVVDKNLVAEFVTDHDIYRQHLGTLNALLQPHDLHFGYRVFDEIMMFLANAEGSPLFDGFNSSLDAAFDAAVLMKVLPKFHGTRGKLRLPLLNVFAWTRTPDAGHDLRKQAEELEKDIAGSEEKDKARLYLIEKLREGPGEARIREETFAYPRMALKALRMLHDLYTTGFASFA